MDGPVCEHVFVSRVDAATILHADLDAFYASVEQRDDPALRTRPVIVGGGVVLSCSYEARAMGVRSAMNGRQARQLCPQAAVVEPRWREYVAASKAVFAVFADTTPLVEPMSIDEAFLDVAGLWRIAGSPASIAARLRREVHERVGLPITVGVARTKFLAKVASGVAKPDGLLVVAPDGELAFLHPLPVGRIWGVGAITAAKLHERGITTVGDIARLPEGALVAILGPASGRHIHALSHNCDPRRIETGRRRRSIGAQRALGRAIQRAADPEAEIDAALVGLVDRVARRMRAADRVGRTITVRFRFGDYTRAARSLTVGEATAHTPTLLAVARQLVRVAGPLITEGGLTLIGIAVSNLHDGAAVQLALPFDHAAADGLDTVIDDVRRRFGSTALTRAVLLDRDPGIAAPLLPD